MSRKFIFISVIVIVIIASAYLILLPLYLKARVEDRLLTLSKRENLSVKYDDISFTPLTNTINIRDLIFVVESDIFTFRIVSEETEVSISPVGWLMGKPQRDWATLRFFKPVTFIEPEESTILALDERAETEQIAMSEVGFEHTDENLAPISEFACSSETEVHNSLLCFSGVYIMGKAKREDDRTDEIPHLEFYDGRVYIKRSEHLTELASDINGFYGSEVDMKFHLLGEGEWTYVKRKTDSHPISLQETTADAEKLKKTILPGLDVRFNEVSTVIRGEYRSSDDFEFNLDLLGGSIQIDKKFTADNYESTLTMNSDGISLNHSHLLWRSSKLEARGTLKDYKRGEIELLVFSDRVRMQDLIELVGYENLFVPESGEVGLLISGTLDDPQYYVRYEKR